LNSTVELPTTAPFQYMIHYSENIVMYRPIARQRLDKHIPAEAYYRNNGTSIARQRINKQTFSTIERLCFLRDP
jgi:hypothetical protein